MKIKLCVSLFSGLLLLCGLSAFAQQPLDTQMDGNLNLQCFNPPCAVRYSYFIDGWNVLGIPRFSVNGSSLHLGLNAGQPSSHGPNTFLGNNAGRNSTYGVGNTAVGYLAGGNNTTGGRNTYIGHYAGSQGPECGGSKPSSGGGSSNTFAGYYAGCNDDKGYENIFLGYFAGYGNSEGNTNIAIGYYAGYKNQMGSHNVYLSNYGADESNTIRIGDSSMQIAAYVAGIYGASTNTGKVVYVDSDGKLGTSSGFDPLAEMQDTIRSQQQQITYLQQQLSRLQALIEKK